MSQKQKFNALILYWLFIELIFYKYSLYNSNKFFQNFDDLFFFETKEEKFDFL